MYKRLNLILEFHLLECQYMLTKVLVF